MEAFIAGRAVVSSSGAFAPPTRDTARASPGPGGGENENGDANDDIVLAERTSQLIDSYRDFVSGRADEEAPAGRIYGCGGDGDGGMRDRHTGPLLRAWSGSRAGCDLEMEEILDSDGHGDGDHRGKKYRNAYGVYRSGKFKQSLVAILAAVVVIACVSGVLRSSRARHLPDWDQELKEELQEEQKTARRGLPHQTAGIELVSPVPEAKPKESDVAAEDAVSVDEEPPVEGTEGTAAAAEPEAEAAETDATKAAVQPLKEEDVREEGAVVLAGAALEAITRHVLCCSSASSPYSRALATKHEARADAANALIAVEYARAEALLPKWYNRSDGWQGTSYDEALAFCAEQREDDGTGMQICPYEAYCPTGPGHLPMGGFRVEENEEGGKTAAYSSRSPVGDRPDGWVQVGSVNVCAQYEIVKANGGTQVKKEVETIMTDILGVKEVGTEVAALSKVDAGAQEGLVEEIYVPNAKPGPAAMVEALVAKSEKSPQASASPKAPPPEQQQALQSPPQTAAAKLTSSESHTSITPEAQANQQSEQKPLPPELKQASQSSSQTAAATTDAATTPQLDMTALLHKKFKPLWLSAADGWNGGSHDDAVLFCQSIRGKALCPYSAICPRGSGHGVMGGRHEVAMSVTGEQYAPVAAGRNHWVMIGDGSGAEGKCRSHRQLEGTAPAWGLNGNRAEVKQHIMCCTVD